MANKYFITQYNLLRIFYGLGSKYEIKGRPYYKYEIVEFKEDDKNLLLFLRLFLEKPLEVFKHLSRIINSDSFSFLIPPSSPAYHNSPDCTSLHNQYLNFYLPEGIKGDPERVAKCRQLFKAQLQLIAKSSVNYSSDEYQKAIYFLIDEIKASIYFRKVFEKEGLDIEKLSIDSFIKINKRNSSSGSISFLEQEIDNLYQSFKHDADTRSKKKGYKRNQAFKREAIDVFRTHYRDKFLQLIIEFIIEQSNPNLEFEEEVLLALGFHQCSNCIGSMDEDVFEDKIGSPYDKYRKSIEQLFEIKSIGKFSTSNTPEDPLATTEEIKSVDEGAYYCLSKLKANLQIAIKLPQGGWLYADLPKSGNGEIILADIYEAFIGTRKDLSENITGNSKKEIILIPISNIDI